MAALEFYLYNVIMMMFHCKHTVFRPDQFDFSFHGPDRPKILGIKKKKRKKKRCGNAWPNCSRSWLQPALTSMFSSAIIRPRTIVKRSIAGKKPLA